MQKYKAIISDIDGTITPLSLHPTPSNKVKKAIRALTKRNFAFCLATGKPFYLIEHLVEELGLQSPIIADNGAAIYDSLTKKLLWQSTIAKDSANKIFSIAKIYKKVVRVSSGKRSYELHESIPSNLEPTKFVTMGLTIREADDYVKKIENKFKNMAVIRASAYEGDGFLDVYVTNAEATKQHAILKIAELLDIKTNEMIGVGDHYNDFPLLMACGLKVAMGNAVEALKAIADYIASSVDDDGIADVIEKFILR